MLYAQLAAKDDVIGRLLAVEQLESQQDQEAIAKLQETLNHDSFFGVRVEAAGALRSIHTEEALSALLSSTNQPDARVRQQVAENIGAFYRDQTYDALRQTLAREKNPAIISSAIRALGGYAEPEVRETLLQFLDSQSYRNELADAAVEALRAQDDPADVPPLLERLPRREADFTSRGFAQGLETLAYLARNEEKKNDVREFLLGQVNHKKRVVRLAAINALGTLGDPRAIAVLQTFALASKASPERVAAETALASLRAVRKPVDDFKNLRQEVLDLQKANRDLRKELEDLKKKVETAKSSIPAKRDTVVPKTTAKSPKASD
jgi:aminopeptidase N